VSKVPFADRPLLFAPFHCSLEAHYFQNSQSLDSLPDEVEVIEIQDSPMKPPFFDEAPQTPNPKPKHTVSTKGRSDAEGKENTPFFKLQTPKSAKSVSALQKVCISRIVSPL